MAYTVTFWGTRGSIPTPGAHTARYGGNTPCVAVEGTGRKGGGQLVILDAGTGIRALGRELVEREHGLRDRQRARAGGALRDPRVVAQGFRDVPGWCGAADPRRDVYARGAGGAPGMGPLDLRGGGRAGGRCGCEALGAVPP